MSNSAKNGLIVILILLLLLVTCCWTMSLNSGLSSTSNNIKVNQNISSSSSVTSTIYPTQPLYIIPSSKSSSTQTSSNYSISFYVPPVDYCCKHCTTGKACGDTCISRSKTCHVGPGCACDY